VPFIARWSGRIPAGQVSDALGVMPDVFATTLAAAGISPPNDRIIDGRNLLPVLTSGAASPHDVIFGHQGPRLATIRDGRWKLHVLPAIERRDGTPGERWIDPWGPDGVTILAPYEQYQPTDYPGIRTGDPGKAGALFDLRSDPAEQRDVSAQHPDVVARLRKQFDIVNAEVPVVAVGPANPKAKAGK
jgi:arylsulfatase A-like enzyme